MGDEFFDDCGRAHGPSPSGCPNAETEQDPRDRKRRRSMSATPSEAQKLLLQLYLVARRHGHEPGPSEDEVGSRVADYLFNRGLDPAVTDVIDVHLGEDWAWAKGGEP